MRTLPKRHFYGLADHYHCFKYLCQEFIKNNNLLAGFYTESLFHCPTKKIPSQKLGIEIHQRRVEETLGELRRKSD